MLTTRLMAQESQRGIRDDWLHAIASGDMSVDPAYWLKQPRPLYHKYQFCLAMAEQYRNKFWAGLAESEASIINPRTRSARIRYRRYSIEARRLIGARLWTESFEAKEIISAEQMYSRWASMYANAVMAQRGRAD